MDNNQVFYEKKTSNQVSWKRRLSKYTLTAEGIQRKQCLSDAIFQATKTQDIIQKTIMLSILSDILDSSDSSSDDSSSVSSSLSTDSSSSSSAGTSDGNEMDEDEQYLEMLFTLAVCLNESMTLIHRLGHEYLNQFGVEHAEWNQVQQNPEPKNRRLQDWTPLDLKTYCTFEYDEVAILLEYFFDDGEPIYVIRHGHKIEKEFSVIIGLVYLTTGANYTMLQKIFGGETTLYSFAINFFFDHLYQRYYNHICGESYKMWIHEIPTYRTQIWKTAFESIIDFEHHRLFGWVDCKGFPSTRPGGSGQAETRNERIQLYELQRAFYSAYGKSHGLRLQAITLPNGIFAHIFIGPMSQNDKGLINLSGIQEALLNDFHENDIQVGLSYPCLGGDDIYVRTDVVDVSPGGRTLFDLAFKGAGEKIEHHFGLVMSLWSLLSIKRKMKILHKDAFQKRLVVAHFLTNCFTCFRGNTVATTFNCEKPDIHDYLSNPIV